MDQQLEARLMTAAEMKLLDMAVREFITEILSEYGEDKVRMTAARIGLSELLMKQAVPPQGKGEKERKE